MRLKTTLPLLVSGLLIAGCAATSAPTTDAPPAASESAAHGDHAGDAAQVAALTAAPGEQLVSLSLPGGAYTPEAPNGGTDDYRCFVLDLPVAPGSSATGFQVVPGNPNVTHHAILYKITADQVPAAEAKDAADDRPGYECFGGTGVSGAGGNLEESDWITAWAPGGEPTTTPAGYGVGLPDGGKVILQMHYNTRGEVGPDDTKVNLAVAPASAGLKPLFTSLLPAPVELPCLEGQTGPLCDRSAALADVVNRFGKNSARVVTGLGFLCGTPTPGPTQTCTRTITQPETLFAAAGHMHLLGRSITIDVNPDTPEARRVLDVTNYDFDQQNPVPLAEPMQLQPGDTVRVTCTHDQSLRGKVPGIPVEPRYVLWGEGTTDEMCLGVLIAGKDA